MYIQNFDTILNVLSLTGMVVGGGFGLYQWRKSLIIRRTEIVHQLITDVRSNETVATIMSIIDWNKDFSYNGFFSISKNTTVKELQDLDADTFMRMIDHTLSFFNYICYLLQVKIITKKDILFFEYEIRRLIDNPHICNYLYSLYHWSRKLKVQTSFSYIVDYGMKMKYLDKCFKSLSTNTLYHCYLQI